LFSEFHLNYINTSIMKKIITLLLLLISNLIYSQSPGITYQAVLYNPGGEILPGNNNTNAVLSNKNICLRFSITDAQSNLEYQETQKEQTDEFGMVNLLIGSGSQVGGYASNFNTIVWNSNAKKLQVEIDVTGTCANFIEVSNQNFSAVPFAYASKIAESVSGIVPIVHGGTGSSTVSGAKTNLGLNNVDNTNDSNKPISIATQTALNGKESSANKSTNTSLGTSDMLFPTQNAVKTYVDNQVSSGVIDATSGIKGKIKLTGDLGGTADAPTVPGLTAKENSITVGTTSQYFRGDKSWQLLNKTAVGLANVDNTSDLVKPISSATQTALNSKEDSSNKSTSIGLGTSDVLFPTQNAVKSYIDSQITTVTVSDASTTSKGKIQLGGDLGGTADAPTVPGLANKENTISAGTISQYFRGDKSWQLLNKTVVGLANVDNTSDLIKPISTATQTALNSKEDSSNKSTSIGLGTSDVLFPTQNAVKSYVDTQITTVTVSDASTISKGKIQLGGDLAGTSSSATNPIISNAAITTLKIADNAVTNAKIGEIVSVNKGGTGADMSTTTGYLKQATVGGNFTTVSSIPVADIAGAVHSVNGVFPATNGNVSVVIGQVTTGTNSDPTQVVTSPHNSDIYVVSGQTGTPNDNGRTFINDGANWHEIATNIASLENTFVKLSGSTMFGNLVFPAGKKITITDAPIGSTDVANKNYVDTKIGGSGTVNYLSKFNSASLLENSSMFDDGTNLGIGTTTPTSKFEVVGNIKSRNTGNTNSIILNNSLATLDITSASRIFRFGSYTGGTYASLIDGTVYVAGVSGISQLSMNTPGNQPITFATNDWLERMRIQPTTGNVGIGTNNPTSKLEINGAATNAAALNSVAATTIDFSKSNLAYTTASAGAFTLTNIKDGGTFTLAVQGANSGTSTFTSTGFTFKYVNNGITSPNKHTLYTFLVMGTTVYVYMATGF
jgi:hypothetical protein